MSGARIQHVADLARGWVDEGITPSLVVLVARRGVIVLHEAFGRMAPAADAPPLPRDAIFPLASISKPLTATAAMILVEEGRLGLNRPVAEYIPEFVGDGKEAVLVHHLLTHTSGLRDEDWVRDFEAAKSAIPSVPIPDTQHPFIHNLLAQAYGTPLWKAPGVEMSYCNLGYLLLGEITRRVSGEALADFCARRIFAPLGMQDTHFILPESAMERVVKHPATEQFAFLDDPFFHARPLPHAGALSTALDMAIFGQMMLNRGHYGDVRILSPVTVAAMTCNQIPGIGAIFQEQQFAEASWGLGWDIHGSKNSEYIGGLCSPQAYLHGGYGGVQLWVDPFYEMVGVYFSVVTRLAGRGLRPAWQADLFLDAVMASVIDA